MNADTRYLGDGLTPEEAGQRADDLQAAGATTMEVLRACYGVEFPSELAALLETDLAEFNDLGVLDAALFWYLAWAPARSGPTQRRPFGAADDLHYERQAFERDPDFVPVFDLEDADYPFGAALVGYRRSALAEGDTRAFRLPRDRADEQHAEAVAPCLLDVLAAWLSGEREEAADQLAHLDPFDAAVGMYREQLETADALLAVLEACRAPTLTG